MTSDNLTFRLNQITSKVRKNNLFFSQDPLPAVFKLFCSDSGEFFPWITDENGQQAIQVTFIYLMLQSILKKNFIVT